MIAGAPSSGPRPREMCDHRFAGGIERCLRRHPMRLADAMDAHAVRSWRVTRLELCAELARHHAAAFVDLHDPCSAQELEVLIDGSLGHCWAEAESPGL